MKEAPGGQGGPQTRHEEGNQDGKGGAGGPARTSQLPRPTTHRYDNKPHFLSQHAYVFAIPFVLTSVPSLNVSPLRQHADTLPLHKSTLQQLHELTRLPTPRGIHGSPLRPPESATAVCRYHPLYYL